MQSTTNIISMYQRMVKRSMDWSLGVKAEAKLAGMALRVIPLVFGHLTKGYVKVTWGFAKMAAKMYRRVGFRGLAIYLKTCYLLTQHVAGGQVARSPWKLGCNVSRTRSGVPRVINSNHRRLIIGGDVNIIRFWLTLFGLYRVLPFKGTLKLKTIYEPGKDLTVFMRGWRGWVPVYLGRLRREIKSSMDIDLYRDLRVQKIPVITKSSPNSAGNAASGALPLDLLAYWRDSEMKQALLFWLKATQSSLFHSEITPIFSDFNRLSEEWSRRTKIKPIGNPIEFLRRENVLGARWIASWWGKPLYFGRLGFKVEPGKIRVFAMVNLITQTLMLPLHEWIFMRLRELKTDGTFNQTAPVERLVKRFIGREFVASYDLSAATDRLPVVMQVALLEPLLGRQLARTWAFLLTGRPYGLPKVAKSYNLGFDKVYYAVGQPMGALSSWAMLALTHHAIIQYAAYLAHPAKPGWFQEYALLGDDIVIADRAVAEKYLVVMDTIGVEVGLAKSLVSSTGSLEFAKRTWVKGRLSSPFSLAEISVAVANVTALEELFRKARVYGEIRVAAVARFSAFGYKNLARLPVAFSLNNRLSRLLGYLCRPGGLWPMPFEAWVMSDGPGRQIGLDWKKERDIARSLVGTLAALIKKVLDRVEREVNRTFALRLTEAKLNRKATAAEARTSGNRRGSSVMKDLYGPILKENLSFQALSARWDPFFSDWVLYPFITPLSRKYSELRVRLRGFGPDAVHGFTGIEQAWRWIDDLERGLKSLPGKIDLFSRQDDVRVAPSKIIRLWMKLRRKAGARRTRI